MKLFVIEHNVWDANDYFSDNSNPRTTDYYLFDKEENARNFPKLLDFSNEIYNECFLYQGEVDDETLCEVSCVECIDDFIENMEIDVNCFHENKGFYWPVKEKIARMLIEEVFDIMDYEPIEAQNYDFNKSIEGCVVAVWEWNTHVGYCRKIKELRFGYYGETEENLTKDDITYCSMMDVIMTKEEVEKSEDLAADLKERLLKDYWKWNNPYTVENLIELLVE